MPGGERCPRCHYNEGYPVSFGQAILKGQKMRFSCRRCGHKWIKRNSFSVISWFVYGIGGIIGIGIGIFHIAKKGFLGELLRGIQALFMGLFDIIAKYVSGFFAAIVNIIKSPGFSVFLIVCIIFISTFIFLYVTIKAFQKWGLIKGLVYLFTSLIFWVPFPVWCILLIKDYHSSPEKDGNEK
jgi:hypothetical protein